MNKRWQIKTIDCPQQSKTFLHVYRGNKLITTFNAGDEAKADRYVQCAIEDERHYNE